MIVGIGHDIVDVLRFNNVLDRRTSHFLSKYFTPVEIEYGKNTPAKFHQKMASAWAVKEATAKALGTGIAHGVRLQDIELVRNKHGAPAVLLKNTAHQVAKKLVDNGTYKIFVTVSHDANVVCAMVILQKNT